MLSSKNADLKKPKNLYMIMAARLSTSLCKKYLPMVTCDPNKALIEACDSNRVDLAEWLITAMRADPDAEWGTPLQDACSLTSTDPANFRVNCLNFDLIKMLVDNGASLSLYNYKAIKLAADNHCSEAVIYMVEAVFGKCDMHAMQMSNQSIRDLLDYLIYHYISMNDVRMIDKFLSDYRAGLNMDALFYIEIYLILSRNKYVIDTYGYIRKSITGCMNGPIVDDTSKTMIIFDAIMASGSTYMIAIPFESGPQVRKLFLSYLANLPNRQKYKIESNSVLMRLFEQAVKTNNSSALEFLKMIGVNEFRTAPIIPIGKEFQ